LKPLHDRQGEIRRSIDPYLGYPRKSRDEVAHQKFVKERLEANPKYMDLVQKCKELAHRENALIEAGKTRKEVLHHRWKAITAKVKGKYGVALKGSSEW
jgi:hypothetical protein